MRLALLVAFLTGASAGDRRSISSVVVARRRSEEEATGGLLLPATLRRRRTTSSSNPAHLRERARRRRGGATVLENLFRPWLWSNDQRLKALSLVALALQNSLLTLTMRYSRTTHLNLEKPRFLPSEAVVMSELLKGLVSFALATRAQTKKQEHPIRGALKDTYGEAGSYVLMLPAAMYVLQNNLQYVAASNLEPAIFQLLYQMKLLTTAFFSVVMLSRRLKPQQWGAIALLACGLSGVGMTTSGIVSSQETKANFAVGFTAVFAACCSSGFSSVFFERVVKLKRRKNNRSSEPISVWARNAQLASFSWVIALVGAYIKDGERIRQRGLLAGFTPLVWLVVALQAGGGLCTAAVIAYADNLLKGFATGVSMLLSVAASCLWFDFEITKPFLAGAASVVAAILLYSRA